MTLYYSEYASPIGALTLIGDADCLHRIVFPSDRRPVTIDEGFKEDDAVFSKARTQLDGYFDGSLNTFSIKLAPAGTEFQCLVWSALQKIQYGEKRSYRDVATSINKPTATRAVGAANGANPIPIIIPCHRVIGSNGSLTGFAGGLLTKQWLLAHEAGEQSLFPFDEFLA